MLNMTMIKPEPELVVDDAIFWRNVILIKNEFMDQFKTSERMDKRFNQEPTQKEYYEQDITVKFSELSKRTVRGTKKLLNQAVEQDMPLTRVQWEHIAETGGWLAALIYIQCKEADETFKAAGESGDGLVTADYLNLWDGEFGPFLQSSRRIIQDMLFATIDIKNYLNTYDWAKNDLRWT